MKIGDIIYRKDMPSMKFIIVDESKKWNNMFLIQEITHVRGLKIRKGMIDKDDDRWDILGER